jgi:Bifunctional DNA primase/polymerase, N-terminal
MLILEYFNGYVRAGLRPIALYPGSKVPVGKDWNRRWDENYWRNYLVAYPDSNIGLLLGKYVDVEGDTDLANRQLEILIGDYPHPTFHSSKSTHHLFLNPDPKLTGSFFNDLEFRAYGLQSVLPPSTHPDGTHYQWMSGCKFPPPPMPPALAEYYWVNRPTPKQHGKRGLKAGHVHPWCSICRKRCYIHEKRFQLECQAFAEIGYKWQCHACRECDVREACRRLRKSQVSLTVPPVGRVAKMTSQ